MVALRITAIHLRLAVPTTGRMAGIRYYRWIATFGPLQKAALSFSLRERSVPHRSTSRRIHW